jgi:hypothetical protein
MIKKLDGDCLSGQCAAWFSAQWERGKLAMPVSNMAAM